MAEYKTAAQRASCEFIERRSRFIGTVCPVQNEAQAAAFIDELRAKYWDATHNVYAYTLRDGQTRRYSDDGEPQGTAGVPVLDVLLKAQIVDTAVVVTRYFGGVLLGAGGLVRAYSHTAALALEAGGIKTMRLCVTGELACDYGWYGRVAALLPECGGIADSADFSDEVRVLFHIRADGAEQFYARLADTTNGQARVRKTGECFLPE